jgi:signal transduction histidine kinase
MIDLEGAISPSAATISELQHPQDDLLHFQKMVALGELSGGIIHDFRNVLQTIISTLELLEVQSDDPAEVHRLTASALRASERGIGLTRRLLNFSRREAKAIRPICLVSSLESVKEVLSRTVEARMNVGIEQPLPNLWPVVVDPIELELALINLGLNARDAMPKGGRIRFSARNVTIPVEERRAPEWPAKHVQDNRRGPRLTLAGGDYVAVSVDDTGTGMDEATLARAMEPFFTTKGAGKGTGLGLATVHTLATRAKGALRLTSLVGRGTTVQLWLPRGPAARIGRGEQQARQPG